MIKHLAALVLGLAFASAAAAQEAPRYDDLQMNTVAVGGENRSVGLYVPPSYNAGHPAPLIIALHGRFSSAKAMHAMSHLRALADARGAILAYPQTAGPYWNDGGFPALGRREIPHDDDTFIASLESVIGRDYAIDPHQVLLVGYDTGGLMAFHLACQGRMHIAGVAIVSALMWDYGEQACASASIPTPMLIVHGRRDEVFPEGGGRVPGGQVEARRLGVTDTLAVWRRINGCNGQPITGRAGSALYAGCTAPLAYVGVDNGDHDWFHDGPHYHLNRQGVDATALIDSFFFERATFALPARRDTGPRGRSYIVYVPPNYDASRPTPVVFVLHGRPSTAQAMAAISDMNAVAARHGFIVVYPQGLNNEWNAIYDIEHRRTVAPQNDIAFLETLVVDLGVDLNIDAHRSYVSGFSNGAFMTLRLACTESEHFAAFAEVSAELYNVLSDQCRGRPAPILLMHGTADRSVPYNGIVIADGQNREETNVSMSAQRTVGFFIARNHCSFNGAQTILPQLGQSEGTRVLRFAPHDCAPGADVLFYMIDGGGHNWPGVPGVMDDAQFGPVNQDINAGEVIWDFLQHYRLDTVPPPRS